MTGQLNGKIKVTGYFTYNDEIFESSCEINIEGQPERIATRKIKLLTYGNSIQKHAPNASLGWEGNWGMAATSGDKDYVHRLIYYLEQKYGVELCERGFIKTDMYLATNIPGVYAAGDCRVSPLRQVVTAAADGAVAATSAINYILKK